MSAKREPVKQRLVLPGDILLDIVPETEAGKIILGPGLQKDPGGHVTAVKPGLLRSHGNSYWVDTQCRRYVSTKGDCVIGIINQRQAETFKVDIGSAEFASLPHLAFEGATKKNRPNLQPGDIVYCRVVIAIREMEPEIVCFDSEGKARGLGALPNQGLMFQVPLNVVRKILSPECELLKLLGKHISFEITTGMNGRIWVKTAKAKDTIGIANAISLCEYLPNDEMKQMVAKIIDGLQNF